jgi:NOL1/NOP2/fmu family ribosome biogenesis protein
MRTLRNEAFSRTGLPLGKFKNLSTLVSRRVSSALKKKAKKKKER